MRKNFYYLLLSCCFTVLTLTACQQNQGLTAKDTTKIESGETDEEEHDKYDEAQARIDFEIERTKDPKLGYVPLERMLKAVDYTENLKSISPTGRTQALNWVERGPNFDTVGPSNGNLRGASKTASGVYTAGRTRALLIDTLNDPTGNTVFCGSVAGGLWKCTNFLSSVPNWQVINDRFDNLAISYICQDPSNPQVMYFSTGEPYSNSDRVSGLGVWKSTNGGATWTRLMATASFNRIFRIICDASGNVYLAARTIAKGLSEPVSQSFGVMRSKDQGATWTDITPTVFTSSDQSCTDLEISANGRLHISLGYFQSRIQHQYTNDPANVTPTVGWVASTGIRTASTTSSYRMELAAKGDTLYAATVNTASNLDSIYKSIDNGATWTKQNTAAPQTGILNGQGWYNLTLSINPTNSNEIIVGGLDAYKSSNGGSTFNRLTYWVGALVPYVHADHHFMQWWMVGNQSRIVIGCDGGVYLSNDAGATFADRNRNLNIKQFYDGAIHPAQGSNYMLAGAQDNGTHQLNYPGLGPSIEVTGGDGCYVHINQQNPQIQFGSYVYNNYRRSTNGGATWTGIGFGDVGRFVNPYDYDDAQNILYATYTTSGGRFLRWKNAATTSTDTTTTLSVTGGTPSAFKVSTNVKDRLFIATGSGKLTRVENASTVTSSTIAANRTDISGSEFPTGYINCVNTGSNDSFLVVTYTSYGVKHVFYSSNAGISWTNIDGTPGSGGLPDMPIRWAVFDPQNNSKIILATEAGVYSTDAVNGANTVWTADANFPTVRTDALQLRLSDNTLMAATHGRGVFTAVLPSTPEVRFTAPFANFKEGTDSVIAFRNFKTYAIDVSMVAAPSSNVTVVFGLQAGNTAMEGLDFAFSTNEDFSTPSKQLVFNSGAQSVKKLYVRIYNDAEGETDESFTITSAISGSNATTGTNNNFTVTIEDDDFGLILPTTVTQNYQIGAITYFLTYGTNTAPLDPRLSSRRSQILYTAAELTSAGMNAGTINNIVLYLNRAGTGIRGYSNFTVKMGQTPLTTLINGNTLAATPATTTVKNPYTFTPANTTSNGYLLNTITLDAPFVWNGTSSIVVELCYNNVTADSSLLLDRMIGSDDGTTSGQSRFIWQDNIDCAGAFNASSSNFNFFEGIRPTIRFNETYTTSGSLAATALNTERTEYFATGSPVDSFYFFSNNLILASFKNTSNFNYGTTQVIIDRAGSDVVKFFSETDTSKFLMSKTYRVLPSNNSPSGRYTSTFYFSKQEKDAWESKTKQNFLNIQVIKVPGQISSVTPSTPNAAGAVEVVNPISVGSFGNIFFITAEFNTGFSGFGFGLPYGILPANLTFNGKVQGNDALLEWVTTSEQNTKTFEVEKSVNGIAYRTIGTVKAAGSSNAKRTYSFLDKDFNAEVNYYRLTVVDNDNRTSKTNTVVLRSKAKQALIVVNNPFSTYIDVRFVKAPQGRVKLQLADLAGRVMHTQVSNSLTQNVLRFDLSSKTIGRGIYVLTAEVDGMKYSSRVMKQ